jgi:outer membrane immunogenic protein
MNRLLTAVVAFCALSASAFAADLSSTKDPVAFSQAPVWTGFYAGATLGAGYNTVDSVEGYLDYDEYGTGHASNHDISVNGGATLGYNWQFRSLVLGAEADVSLSSFSTSSLMYESEVALKSQMDWFTTARLRAGYATDNFLFYVTGGAVWANVKHTSEWVGEDLCGHDTDYTSCVSRTELGVASGVGVEAMLSRKWSVKAEYLHFAFPTIKTQDSEGPYNYTWNDSADIVRAGLNYHF